MSTIVDELVTLLGIEINSNTHPTLHKFTSAIDKVGKFASVAAAGITAVAASIVYFAEKSADAGAEIERFHQLTGMSTDSIQQWMYAAQQVSGNKESILRDIERITTELNPIMPGNFNQGMFLFFGEGLKNITDTNTALREMAKVFPKLTEQKALQWGGLMGISPETVLLLRQGNAGLDQLFAKTKQRILRPEDTKAALKYAQAWDDIKDSSTKFLNRVGIKLLPTLGAIIEKSIKWWEANHKLISSGLERFVEGVSKGFDKFFNILSGAKTALPWVGKLFDLIMDPRLIGGGVMVALTGIAAVLGVIAAKYALIGAAVIGAIAAVEDFSESMEDPEVNSVTNRVRRGIDEHPFISMLGPVASYFAASKAPESSEKTPLVGMLEGLRDMMKNGATPLSINQAYMDRRDPELAAVLKDLRGGNSGSSMSQTNHLTVVSPDPYSAGAETVHQLERLRRVDFSTRGPAATVN